MRRGCLGWLFLSIVLLLAGCNASAGQAVAPTSTASGNLPDPKATVAPTLSPTTSPTVSPPTATPTRTPTPTHTPTPYAAGWCSPLAEWPLETLYRIRSRGMTPPPPDLPDGGHQGVDLAPYSPEGPLPGTVQAMLTGRVAALERGRFPYGYAVILETPAVWLNPALRERLGLRPDEALYVLYAHLAQAPDLALEQVVPCGTALAPIGCSGNCGVQHLHLEMRIGPAGLRFPEGLTYRSRQGTPASNQAYRFWRFEGPLRLLDPWRVLNPSP